MQKKIYSLLFVPCALALCLALGFLISCGDTGGDDGGKEPAKPPVGPPVCTDGCDNAEVEIKDLGWDVGGGWDLTISGSVKLIVPVEDDTTYIKTIRIKMYNVDAGGENKIYEETKNFGQSYSLNEVPAFTDFKKCDINKYTQKIYIDVIPSKGGSKRDSIGPINRPHPVDCNEFGITLDVAPAGAGSAAANPPPPYSANARTTLTATAANNYSFYNWTPGSGVCAGSCETDNPYSITIARETKYTANFVDSRNITFDKKVDLRIGEEGARIGLVSNAINLVSDNGWYIRAANGIQLIDFFQSPDKQFNDSGNRRTLDDDDVSNPSNTNQFVVAPNSEVSSIEYSLGKYFVVKTPGTGWDNWFLLLAQPRAPDCINASSANACLELSIWKVN